MPGQTHSCPQREARRVTDNARRNAKERVQGKKTAHWRRLRASAIERDGRCLDCGTSADLTVDLVNEELGGDHRLATLEDVATRCRSCHGSKDAPRASRR